MSAETDVKQAMDTRRDETMPDPDAGMLASLTNDESGVARFNISIVLSEVRALQAGVLALAKALDARD